MKHEETIAKAFLKTYFGIEPVYEPLGQGTPPDFCIDKIAFEVRRLNENYLRENGKAEGLEQATYALDRAVFAEFEKIPISPQVGSFFIGLTYARPLHVKVRTIAKELAKQARSHYSSGSRAKKTIMAHGVTAELIPASNPYKKAFVRGFEVDDDSAGWIIEIYRNNIQLALGEKITKTRNVAEKFDRWVLLLLDSITPGISWANEMGAMFLDLHLQHFSSVAVINRDGSLVMEWPNNSLKGTP